MVPKFSESVEAELASWYQLHTEYYVKQQPSYKKTKLKDKSLDELGARYDHTG
jgi:hypothetical protein